MECPLAPFEADGAGPTADWKTYQEKTSLKIEGSLTSIEGLLSLQRRFAVPPERVCCPSREGLLSFQRWLVVPPERVSCPLTGFINLVLNLPSENFPQDWGLIVPLEDSVSLFRRHLDVMPSGCSWTVFFLPMISTDQSITCRTVSSRLVNSDPWLSSGDSTLFVWL